MKQIFNSSLQGELNNTNTDLSTHIADKTKHKQSTNIVETDIDSNAEGTTTSAIGASSHAEGASTTAASDYAHVEGRFTLGAHGPVYKILAVDDAAKHSL